jgi:hypothetical protein
MVGVVAPRQLERKKPSSRQPRLHSPFKENNLLEIFSIFFLRNNGTMEPDQGENLVHEVLNFLILHS